ncbi:MAG: hypothetical protein KatS3mg019_0684 [Fimbriimonadales bacterium]|nr:MAG: hypothetical protein KatS3mg019_0684 [Fimbriimonadales bacterium]
MKEDDAIFNEARTLLDQWLETCKRRNRLARNTIAVGIVALHHLRHAKTLPIEREEVVSPGGEIKLSRGSSLAQILKCYGIDATYLKEVTTRQAHQDGQRLLTSLEWGGLFASLPTDCREHVLKALIGHLTEIARQQLQAEAIRIRIDQRQSPLTWVRQILEMAQGRSPGIVEQHLVGAKLEARFPEQKIPTLPVHAADSQTRRSGDYELQASACTIVIHVTAQPSRALLEKCAENLRQGQLPLILTLREKEQNALVFAEEQGIGDKVLVISIDHFIATNLIEMALTSGSSLIEVFQQLVKIYNHRIETAETDWSCKVRIE